MNMMLSFNNIGSKSNWPASYHGVSSTNHNLTLENHQLRHMLTVTKSSKFYQVCTAALSGTRRMLHHDHVDRGRGCVIVQGVWHLQESITSLIYLFGCIIADSTSVTKCTCMLQEVIRHIVANEDKIFFTSNEHLSTMCNHLLREKKNQKEHCIKIEAELQAKGPAAERVLALQVELDFMQKQAALQPVIDAKLQEEFDKQELHCHNMLAKLNSLKKTNAQLEQSLMTLQQQRKCLGQQQQPIKLVCCYSVTCVCASDSPLCNRVCLVTYSLSFLGEVQRLPRIYLSQVTLLVYSLICR